MLQLIRLINQKRPEAKKCSYRRLGQERKGIRNIEENFKNWSSGNKEIDELIQHSQLHAVHSGKLLEWIPFENFDTVTY